MRALGLISFWLVTTHAAPMLDASDLSADQVEIRSVSHAGSGCPVGSAASSQLSSDLSTLTLLSDTLIAQAGHDFKPADMRKNCQFSIKLGYPSGWRFSVSKADYRGYVVLGKEHSGTSRATYYFSGDSRQTSSASTLDGPLDSNYVKEDRFGVADAVWSPCGKEGILNVDFEVRISPINTTSTALMTVTAPDLGLLWQSC